MQSTRRDPTATLKSHDGHARDCCQRAEDLLTDFDDLRIERWPAEDALRRRAFQLRDNLTAYDAAYVALAEALDCPLVTRDSRLARSSGHGARVEVR